MAASRNPRTWSTLMFTSTPLKEGWNSKENPPKIFFVGVCFPFSILNKALMLHSASTLLVPRYCQGIAWLANAPPGYGGAHAHPNPQEPNAVCSCCFFLPALKGYKKLPRDKGVGEGNCKEICLKKKLTRGIANTQYSLHTTEQCLPTANLESPPLPFASDYSRVCCDMMFMVQTKKLCSSYLQFLFFFSFL